MVSHTCPNTSAGKFLEMVLLGQRSHTLVILKAAAQCPWIYRGPTRETEVL